MKLFNKPLFVVGFLAVTIGIGSLAYQGTQNILTIQQSQMQTRQMGLSIQPYNGEKLYAEVFQYIRDKHFNLGDKAKRDAFVAAWQSKFAGKKVKDIPNFALKSWAGKYDDTRDRRPSHRPHAFVDGLPARLLHEAGCSRRDWQPL